MELRGWRRSLTAVCSASRERRRGSKEETVLPGDGQAPTAKIVADHRDGEGRGAQGMETQPNGSALDRFREAVWIQGGDDAPRRWPGPHGEDDNLL